MTTETTSEQEPAGGAVDAVADEQLIAMLVDRARGEGLQLAGEGGLLQQLTRRVLESALDGEITDHVGYDKHDPAGRGSGNTRNGSRTKTVLTDIGPVEVRVPRDAAGTCEPQIVRKRQRRLSGVDRSSRVLRLPVLRRAPSGRGVGTARAGILFRTNVVRGHVHGGGLVRAPDLGWDPVLNRFPGLRPSRERMGSADAGQVPTTSGQAVDRQR
jgi:hypothetical protein